MCVYMYVYVCVCVCVCVLGPIFSEEKLLKLANEMFNCFIKIHNTQISSVAIIKSFTWNKMKRK